MSLSERDKKQIRYFIDHDGSCGTFGNIACSECVWRISKGFPLTSLSEAKNLCIDSSILAWAKYIIQLEALEEMLK